MKKTTKEEILKAGIEMCNRSTPEQQENHKKVLAWILDLAESEIPDRSHHSGGREEGAKQGYRVLICEWFNTYIRNKNRP